MAWMSQAIVLWPTAIVCLKNTWVAIYQIVIFFSSPGKQCGGSYPQCERCDHAYTNIEQPVNLFGSPFCAGKEGEPELYTLLRP